MKESRLVLVSAILAQGCLDAAPTEHGGGAALMPADGDGQIEPLPEPGPGGSEIDIVPAGPGAAKLGIVSWEVSADGAAERYALTGLAADGSAVQTVEVFGDADGITLLGPDGGMTVIDLQGNVVSSTLAPEEQAFLALAQPDLEAAAAQGESMARPSRACVIWTGLTLAFAAACGSGAWPACIGLVGAFCNASHYCGNNVCGM